MLIQGIQPGPSVMTEQPTLFWGLIASMWIGNLMLLVLNLPMIGLSVRMIAIPYHFLFPSIIALCAIGVFSVNNSLFDVYAMALFGVVGYLFRKLDAEPAPMLLAFILGPMMEEFLRRRLLFSKGDPSVFLTRPLSAVLLAIAAILLLAGGSARRSQKERRSVSGGVKARRRVATSAIGARHAHGSFCGSAEHLQNRGLCKTSSATQDAQVEPHLSMR